MSTGGSRQVSEGIIGVSGVYGMRAPSYPCLGSGARVDNIRKWLVIIALLPPLPLPSKKASENASKQQSLNVVSSFVNAPSPHSGSSPYSDALLAFISLVIPDVPPLLPSSKAVSDEEVMELLCAEWKRREAQCAVDAEAWEKDLYVSFSIAYTLRCASLHSKARVRRSIS